MGGAHIELISICNVRYWNFGHALKNAGMQTLLLVGYTRSDSSGQITRITTNSSRKKYPALTLCLNMLIIFFTCKWNAV